MARWLAIMDEKSQAREAEELRRVAEIVLGRALQGRDCLARVGAGERAKSSPAQAGQTAGKLSPMSRAVLNVTYRAIDIAQDAYRGAVAQMQWLTRRQNADAGADLLDAIKEKAVAEEAERKAPEEKRAAVATTRKEVARQPADEGRTMNGVAREVAPARAAAKEATKRQRKRRAPRLKGSQSPQRRKPKQEADLPRERVRAHELEHQLSIRENDQELLAPEAAGNPEAVGLMEQARLLLDQGNIIAARGVLERAAESGDALALFLLAETYDPASLSAWGIFSTWGIFGRRGDAAKAQELYAKAAARGVNGAKYRLSALR